MSHFEQVAFGVFRFLLLTPLQMVPVLVTKLLGLTPQLSIRPSQNDEYGTRTSASTRRARVLAQPPQAHPLPTNHGG